MTAPSDWRTGKVCYLELPAADVEASADFYRQVFGWRIDRRGDGALSFTDTVGGVSGVFVTGRAAASAPGMLVYVMVADAATALASIRAAGGTVIASTPPDATETFARFADPAGNVLGIYQQPGLAEAERTA